MKLSLIITTYNQHLMLTRVLEGVRRQYRLPDEVLIADDGSGPETADVIKRFQQDFPCPLHHIWHDDQGFRAAEIRNKAIRQASGDYLTILDGDCIPPAQFIQDHYNLAEPGCFFQGKRILVSEQVSKSFSFQDTTKFRTLIAYWLKGGLGNGHHLIRLTAFPSLYSKSLKGIRSCNTGFFKKDAEAVNGYNQDFTGWGREDSELAVRFFKYGLRKKEHPFMAVCFHLWHGEADRSRLKRNDELLNQAIASKGWVCANGLVRYPQNIEKESS